MPTIFTRGAASARGFGLFGAVAGGPALWSWGLNSIGQLGLGNLTAYSSPKQVGALTNWFTVSTGETHSLAVKTDGTLWAWGYGKQGRLGVGNITNYSSPKQVGALTTWSTVSGPTSGYSSLAVKTDGTLWSWGYNGIGQLGLGNMTNYYSPKQVGALTGWSTVSAGNNSSLAVKTNGTLWAVGGFNNVGQLGLGNTTYYSSPKQIGALTTWSTVSTRQNSSLAVKTDGTLWSWGNNNNGQLGLGNLTNYSSPKQVGALTGWSKVTTGTNFTLALKT